MLRVVLRGVLKATSSGSNAAAGGVFFGPLHEQDPSGCDLDGVHYVVGAPGTIRASMENYETLASFVGVRRVRENELPLAPTQSTDRRRRARVTGSART